MNKLKSKCKIKLKYLLLLLLILSLLITGAFALFKGFDKAENVFTVGNVKIELTEPNWAPNHDSDEDGVNDTLLNILPGQTIEKDPTITNVGFNDAYVYMLVEIPKAYNVDLHTLTGEKINKKYYPLFKFKNGIDENKWVLISEQSVNEEQGVYYVNEGYDCYLYGYKTPVTKDMSVTLFDSIEFENITSGSADLINELGGLKVRVRAYAIQSDFYDEENISVDKAWNKYVNQNEWQWPHEDLKKVVALNYVDKEGETLLVEPTVPGSEVELYFDSSLAKDGYTFDWIDVSTGEITNNGMIMPDNNVTLMADYTETGYEISDFITYKVLGTNENNYYLAVTGLNTSHENYPLQPSAVVIPSEVTFSLTQSSDFIDSNNKPLSSNKVYTMKVRAVEDNAFQEHKYRIETLVFPATITKLGINIINGFGSNESESGNFEPNQILKNVVFPYKMYCKIPEKMFKHCSFLTSVEMPQIILGSDYYDIGAEAFYGSGITSITLSPSYTRFGSKAFAYSDLTDVYYTGSISSWCNCDFKDAGATPMCDQADSVAVSQFKTKQFYLNDTPLTELVIPDNVTTLKSFAFYGFNTLNSVKIGNKVSSIGSLAFKACSTLSSITISDSVKSIGSQSFSDCKKLTVVVVPDSVEVIGPDAFSNCTNLNFVSLGNGLTNIGYFAFSKCTGLTSITIPDSVVNIGDNAFDGCSNLRSALLPEGLVSIGSCAFRSCGLASISIPDSVTSVGSYAFQNCVNMTAAKLSNGMATLSTAVLGNCHELVCVTIPKSIKTISSYNFQPSYTESQTSYSAKLKYVIYTGTNEEWNNVSITKTQNEALNRANIICNDSISDGTYIIQNDILYAINKTEQTAEMLALTKIESQNINLFIPSKISNYNITSISPHVYQNNNICKFIVDEENLYYSSDSQGILYNKEKTEIIQVPLNSSCLDIILPETISTINAETFQSSGLKSIIIPESITKIEDAAFSNCTQLETVVFNNCNIAIPDDAFLNCTELKSVSFGDGITLIRNSAFMNCYNLKNIVIPDSITQIWYDAFNGCSQLQTVSIGAGVQMIDGSFVNCPNLEAFVVSPDNNYYSTDSNGVLYYTYASNNQLAHYLGGNKSSSYTVLETTTSVICCGFESNIYLNTLYIPDSVQAIYVPESLSNCVNLTDIYYAGTESQWNSITNSSKITSATIHYNS